MRSGNRWLSLLGSTVVFLGHVGVRGELAPGLMSFEFIAAYHHRTVLDISADGQNALFYQSTAPVRMYHAPSGGNSKRVREWLVITNLDSRRDVARVPVEAPRADAFFLKGTTEVVLLDQVRGTRAMQSRYRLWRPGAPNVDALCESHPLVASALVPIGGKLVAGFKKDPTTGREQFVVITAMECSVETQADTDPEDRAATVTPGTLAAAPNGETVAYVAASHERGHRAAALLVRGTRDARVYVRNNLYGQRFGRPVYLPDAKRILLAVGGTANQLDSLLVIDVASGRVLRTLKVGGAGAVAVAPNGAFIAVGDAYRRDNGTLEVQARVDFYRLSDGSRTGSIGFPWIAEQRHDPWAATVAAIRFSPDGTRLFASTRSTREWKLELGTLPVGERTTEGR